MNDFLKGHLSIVRPVLVYINDELSRIVSAMTEMVLGFMKKCLYLRSSTLKKLAPSRVMKSKDLEHFCLLNHCEHLVGNK